MLPLPSKYEKEGKYRAKQGRVANQAARSPPGTFASAFATAERPARAAKPAAFAAARCGADRHDSFAPGQATAGHSCRRTKAEEEELIYGRASNPKSTRLRSSTARRAIDSATAAVAGEVHALSTEDAGGRSYFRADEQNDRGAHDYARAASEVRQDRETDPKILRAR